MTEPRTVYLAGYSGRQPSWLLAAAVSLDAVVFDVRFSPRSRRPEWSKAALRRLLNDRYRHVSGFGNRLYRSEHIELADPASGLARFDQTSGPVILLCQCRESGTCHRRVVADLLMAERGVTVREIDSVETDLLGQDRSAETDSTETDHPRQIIVPKIDAAEEESE